MVTSAVFCAHDGVFRAGFGGSASRFVRCGTAGSEPNGDPLFLVSLVLFLRNCMIER